MTLANDILDELAAQSVPNDILDELASQYAPKAPVKKPKTLLERAVAGVSDFLKDTLTPAPTAALPPSPADIAREQAAVLPTPAPSVIPMGTYAPRTPEAVEQFVASEPVYPTERLATTGKSFAAGVGQTAEALGGGLEWKGLGGKDIREWGKKVQAENIPAAPAKEFQWKDLLTERYWTEEFPRMVPFSLSLLPLSIGGGVAGAMAGGIPGAMIGAGAAGGPAESFLEAGTVYSEMLDKLMAQGMPEDQARVMAGKAAHQTFTGNIVLNTALNALEFGAEFGPVPKALEKAAAKSAISQALIGTGRMGLGAGLEMVQEVGQERIGAKAKGEKTTPAQERAAAAGAGVMGALLGGVGNIYQGGGPVAQPVVAPPVPVEAAAPEVVAPPAAVAPAPPPPVAPVAPTPLEAPAVVPVVPPQEATVAPRTVAPKVTPKAAAVSPAPPVPVGETEKLPWEMTRKEFRKSHGGQSAVLDWSTNKMTAGPALEGADRAVIRNAGTADLQGILEAYRKKYGLTRPIELHIMPEEGYTGQVRTVRDAAGAIEKYVIWLPPKYGKVRPSTLRHEIEHILDTEFNRAVPDEYGFSRFEHGSFEADYLHRQLVKEALAQGRPVPERVLAEYPDLVSRSVAPEVSILPEPEAKHPVPMAFTVGQKVILRNGKEGTVFAPPSDKQTGGQVGVEYIGPGGKPLRIFEPVSRVRVMEEALTAERTVGEASKGKPVSMKTSETTQAFPQGAAAITPTISGAARLAPIARTAIIQHIEKNFLLPMRKGRLMAKGAAGEYKVRQQVARLKTAEDLQTAAHEFGHHLASIMGLQPNIEVERLGSRLPSYKPAQWGTEGLAEFFRLYFINPMKAQKDAPRFYSAFEARLAKEPEISAKLKEAQDLYQGYYTQSPVERVKGAIVHTQAEASPFLSPAEKEYMAWSDDLYPIYKTMKLAAGEENVRTEWDISPEKNPYILARLARGRTRKANAMLVRNMITPDLEVAGPSFREILEPVRNQIDDFEAYLVAKRAVELHDRGIKTGIGNEDAVKAVSDLESPEFIKAQEELKAYQDNLLDHLIDAGVLNQDTVDSFRALNEYYVPFYRYFGEETTTGGVRAMGKKWVDLPQPVKAIKGSTRSIMSPLTSIVRNTIYLIDVAERNRVARALADLADETTGLGWLIEKLPAPIEPTEVNLADLKKELLESGIPEEVLEEADLERMATVFHPVRYARFKEKNENILTVYRNGKPQFYQVHSELYRSLEMMDQPAANWLLKFLSPFSRVKRAGAVLNPEFAARNPVRDAMSAFMYSKYGFVPVVDTIRGLFHVIGKDELYKKWEASGGAQSTLMSLNQDYLNGTLRNLLRQQSTLRKAAQFANPLTAIEAVGNALEEATRLGEFARGVRKEGRSREGLRKAAYASREVSLDFQRAGTHGRQVNQVKAFFNAGIQGTDKMARAFRADPKRMTIMALSFITIPSILLYLMNHDDPRYQELPWWRKDGYWCIPTKSGFIFIPKPFEMGVLFGTLPERVLGWVKKEDPEAFEEFGRTVQQATLPIDATNPVDWLPDAFLPLVEVYANKSVFTGRPIVPLSEQNLPAKYQYGPMTSETAKAVGRVAGASPRKVEALVRGYGAGVGSRTLAILDALAGHPEGVEAIGFRPFSGSLYKSSASVDKVYEELEQLEQAQAAWNKGLGKKPDERRLKRLRDATARLSAWRKAQQAARDKGGPAQEKIIEMIDVIMVNIARQALGKPEAPVEEDRDILLPALRELPAKDRRKALQSLR